MWGDRKSFFTGILDQYRIFFGIVCWDENVEIEFKLNTEGHELKIWSNRFF